MKVEQIYIGTREELRELLINSPGYREVTSIPLEDQLDKLEQSPTKTSLLFCMRDEVIDADNVVTHFDKWWVHLSQPIAIVDSLVPAI